jgi:hypothetical protein
MEDVWLRVLRSASVWSAWAHTHAHTYTHTQYFLVMKSIGLRKPPEVIPHRQWYFLLVYCPLYPIYIASRKWYILNYPEVLYTIWITGGMILCVMTYPEEWYYTFWITQKFWIIQKCDTILVYSELSRSIIYNVNYPEAWYCELSLTQKSDIIHSELPRIVTYILNYPEFLHTFWITQNCYIHFGLPMSVMLYCIFWITRKYDSIRYGLPRNVALCNLKYQEELCTFWTNKKCDIIYSGLTRSMIFIHSELPRSMILSSWNEIRKKD